MNTNKPEYAMDQSWLDEYVSVDGHSICDDDAISIDDTFSNNHTLSNNDTVFNNAAPVYEPNMAQQAHPQTQVLDSAPFAHTSHVYPDHGYAAFANDLIATSPALECLRANNANMGLYPYVTLSPTRPSRLLLTSGSPLEDNSTSPMPPISMENVWNSSATQALRANYPSYVQQVVPSTAGQDSVKMSDGNKRPSLYFSTHS